MALESELPKHLVNITGLYYVTGNHGTPVSIPEVNTVYDAAVVDVEGQESGSLALEAAVNGIGVSATIYSGSGTMTSNQVLVYAYELAAGTISEKATGTLTQNIKLLVTGH